jgi:hypothetical protein
MWSRRSRGARCRRSRARGHACSRRSPKLARMPDPADRVAALLSEAAETHHRVYRISDGDDPDWASWYADWLARLSELPLILGRTPIRSELVWLLVGLDKQYTESDPGPAWQRWYAERMLEHFSG